MSRATAILVSVVVLALAAAGVLALNNRSDQKQETTSTPQTTTPTPTNPTTPPANTESQHELAYSDSGFSPKSVTANVGEAIKITNNSSSELDFASDPHPVHTDNSELNLGTIMPGQSKTVTITKAGSWGVHDHNNHLMTASLTITE